MPRLSIYIHPWEKAILNYDDCVVSYDVKKVVGYLILILQELCDRRIVGENDILANDLRLLSQWFQSEEVEFTPELLLSGDWNLHLKFNPNEESKAQILSADFILEETDTMFDDIGNTCREQLLSNCSVLMQLLGKFRVSLLTEVLRQRLTSIDSELANAIKELTIVNSPCFFAGHEDVLSKVENLLLPFPRQEKISGILGEVKKIYQTTDLLCIFLRLQKLLVAQYRIQCADKDDEATHEEVAPISHRKLRSYN